MSNVIVSPGPAAPPDKPAKTDVDVEIEAMHAACGALAQLDHDARRRAIRWLEDRLRTEEPPF
jgi:hypothetical protein